MRLILRVVCTRVCDVGVLWLTEHLNGSSPFSLWGLLQRSATFYCMGPDPPVKRVTSTWKNLGSATISIHMTENNARRAVDGAWSVAVVVQHSRPYPGLLLSSYGSYARFAGCPKPKGHFGARNKFLLGWRDRFGTVLGSPSDASFGFYLQEAFQSQTNTERILYNKSR